MFGEIRMLTIGFLGIAAVFVLAIIYFIIDFIGGHPQKAEPRKGKIRLAIIIAIAISFIAFQIAKHNAINNAIDTISTPLKALPKR